MITALLVAGYLAIGYGMFRVVNHMNKGVKVRHDARNEPGPDDYYTPWHGVLYMAVWPVFMLVTFVASLTVALAFVFVWVAGGIKGFKQVNVVNRIFGIK